MVVAVPARALGLAVKVHDVDDVMGIVIGKVAILITRGINSRGSAVCVEWSERGRDTGANVFRVIEEAATELESVKK